MGSERQRKGSRETLVLEQDLQPIEEKNIPWNSCFIIVFGELISWGCPPRSPGGGGTDNLDFENIP